MNHMSSLDPVDRNPVLSSPWWGGPDPSDATAPAPYVRSAGGQWVWNGTDAEKVYMYEHKSELEANNWCGQRQGDTYGTEFFVAATFFQDTFVHLIASRSNVMRALLNRDVINNAIASLVTVFVVVALQRPGEPHNFILFANFFRWIRLFSVADAFARDATNTTVKIGVFVLRLLFAVFAAASLIQFCEWPCPQILEAEPEGTVFKVGCRVGDARGMGCRHGGTVEPDNG